MTPSEYLDEAKKAMGISADNELAKRLETTRSRISAYRLGTQHIAADTAFRIAITLNLDPAMVFADLEAQREKNPQRAEFWRSFLSRAATVAILACTLGWFSIATSGTEAAPLGGLIAASAAVFYARRVRIIWTYVSFSLSICENRL